MKSKKDIVKALVDLCDTVGVPEELVYDNVLEETMPSTQIQKVMRDFYVSGRSCEPYTPKQNREEDQIRELQTRMRWRIIKEKKMSNRLPNYLQSAAVNPKENRAPWYKNTAPTIRYLG